MLLHYLLLCGRLLGFDFILSDFNGKLNFFLGLLDRRDDDLFRRLLRHGRFLRRSCFDLRLLGLRELLSVHLKRMLKDLLLILGLGNFLGGCSLVGMLGLDKLRSGLLL